MGISDVAKKNKNPFAEEETGPIDPEAEHRRETFWTTVILTSVAVAAAIGLLAHGFSH